LATSKGQRYLGIAFFLTLAFCVIEYAGGVFTGSLSLIADAGHMVADLGALGLAFFAAWFAGKKPTSKMTFGYHRIEVLTALVNAALLITIAIGICREGLERLSSETPIRGDVMIVIATAGFIVNVVIGAMLFKQSRENINIAAAFYHVLSDALSSVGVIAAGIVVSVTQWYLMDSIVSFLIAVLISTSALKLLKSVVPVLMEASPPHIDTGELERQVTAVDGVSALHDLHVWTISPGKESLSAHIEVKDEADRDQILDKVEALLSREFNITHTTLQIERTNRPRKTENHFHP